jgi:serine/threonine-protein kinase
MMAPHSRWLAVTLVLLAPLPARAEPPSLPPTEEQVDRGRELYKEARELYRQGRLKESLEKAFDAYKAASTPVTAHFLGKLLDEAGRLVEARDIVRSVALMPISPRESDRGREARQQAAALAAQLDGRIPKLAVGERPRAVEVLLDGKAVPPVDSTAWQGVDPGPHTIAVRADDRICTTIMVTLAEGEARTIDLHDVTASCRPEVPVQDEHPTSPPRAQEARVELPPAPAPGEAERTGNGWPAWKSVGGALFGGGVAAVGVASYLALSAKSDYDSVASHCVANVCDSHASYDVRMGARSRADAATLTMSLGGAAVLGGMLLWFLAPEPSTGHDVGRPHVSIGPGSVALSTRLP